MQYYLIKLGSDKVHFAYYDKVDDCYRSSDSRFKISKTDTRITDCTQIDGEHLARVIRKRIEGTIAELYENYPEEIFAEQASKSIFNFLTEYKLICTK